jgi:acyl-CoA thioesterase I
MPDKTRLYRILLIWLLFLPMISQADGKTMNPILVLGDSLSAGYGIDTTKGWVKLLEARLSAQGAAIQVINASISGETSAGGVNRLKPLLSKYNPSIVILELGGNDGLRGYPIDQMRQELTKAIDLSQQYNAQVLLLGMQIPPNYGPRYSRLFSESYAIVADAKAINRVPFFLQDIATAPELMQQDGIHPSAAGQPQMLDNVWPELWPMIQQLQSTPSTSMTSSDY